MTQIAPPSASHIASASPAMLPSQKFSNTLLDDKPRPVGFETEDYVTMYIGNQIFGIPILQIQDVLGPHSIARIPLAPNSVAGFLNLRGRIVTALDLRGLLEKKRFENPDEQFSVVVEHGNDLYSLLVDEIGKVVSLAKKDFQHSPLTLEPHIRDITTGVYPVEGNLIVILDIPRLLGFTQNSKNENA